jgi:hypothetical protein
MSDNALDEKRKYFNILLEKTSELKNAEKYYNFYYNLMNEIVEFELGFETALARISYETHDSSIEFERSGWIENTVKRFSELMLIDGLARSTGNIDKRDLIIDNYIGSSMFSKQYPSKNQIKNLVEAFAPKKE